MNESLIERHNALVAPDDQVWVLGDVAMGPIAESLACCARMNGRKILVCGNHDRPAMVPDGKVQRWLERYRDEGGFDKVITLEQHRYLEIQLADQWVAISHYPHSGESFDGRPDRYTDRRPLDTGGWLLHGHVHEQWRVNGRQINVGVDVWDFRPVADDQVAELIREAS